MIPELGAPRTHVMLQLLGHLERGTRCVTLVALHRSRSSVTRTAPQRSRGPLTPLLRSSSCPAPQQRRPVRRPLRP
eukprot:14430697-Heterocapsa_arctica.AAC.1